MHHSRSISTAVLLLLALLSSGDLAAQPPIVLNTQVRSFTPVSGTPWVADIWGYTDSLGRDFALVCRGDEGLSIYEITNPAAPVFAASVAATGSDMKDVKVYGNHAFMVQQNGGIRIADISDPYATTVVGSIADDAHNCFVYDEGDLLLTARSGESPPSIMIYDISVPASPVFLSSYRPTTENFHDVTAQDGLAYGSIINSSQTGTDIFDITNPLAPTFVSRVQTGLSTHANWLYNAPGGQKILCSTNETAGGNLKIFDVTDPTNTPMLSQYTTDVTISIHNPVVVDRYCFISYYADYLRILDLSNPAQPIEVGIFDPLPNNLGAQVFDGAWGVAHVRRLPGGAHRLLLTQSFILPRGFWVVDFTPPPTMTLDIGPVAGTGHVLSVGGVDPLAQIFNGVSLVSNLPFGSGPLGGLQGDALASFSFPLGAQPFHVQASAAGDYSFVIPFGLAPGLVFDLRSIGIVSGSWTASEIARYTL